MLEASTTAWSTGRLAQQQSTMRGASSTSVAWGTPAAVRWEAWHRTRRVAPPKGRGVQQHRQVGRPGRAPRALVERKQRLLLSLQHCLQGCQLCSLQGGRSCCSRTGRGSSRRCRLADSHQGSQCCGYHKAGLPLLHSACGTLLRWGAEACLAHALLW